MNRRLYPENDFPTSANKIELDIFYSEEGAPYCEFMPDRRSFEFLVQTVAGLEGRLSGYGVETEGGYAESYPLFKEDEGE